MKCHNSRTIFLAVVGINGERIKQLDYLGSLTSMPGSLSEIIDKLRVLRKPGGVPLLAKAPPTSYFRFYDWAREPLSPDLMPVEIPIPGIVIALYDDAGSLDDKTSAPLLVRHHLAKNPRLQEFLDSHEARVPVSGNFKKPNWDSASWLLTFNGRVESHGGTRAIKSKCR